MQAAGIEMLNIFGDSAYLDVDQLASHRGLDKTRFDNLLMKEKSVALPYEDSVSLAVNAAKPIIDALSDNEKTGSKCRLHVQSLHLISGNR